MEHVDVHAGGVGGVSGVVGVGGEVGVGGVGGVGGGGGDLTWHPWPAWCPGWPPCWTHSLGRGGAPSGLGWTVSGIDFLITAKD